MSEHKHTSATKLDVHHQCMLETINTQRYREGVRNRDGSRQTLSQTMLDLVDETYAFSFSEAVDVGRQELLDRRIITPTHCGFKR